MVQRKSSQHGRGGADLEEIRPRSFLVRNRGAYRLLKGEGDFKGALFEATTWRYDGLVARLRESGFQVETLSDQIASLPALPPADVVGDVLFQPGHKQDRYSFFDPVALTWVAVEEQEQDGQAGVMLRAGWVVRRRRGRGHSTFYQVALAKGGNPHLSQINETRALLAGYAQASALTRRSPLRASRGQKSIFFLPAIEMPAPHREIMQRLGEKTEQGWQVGAYGFPLAQQVYAALGLRLVQPGVAKKKRSRPR